MNELNQWIQYALLGLLQGFTEPIPVSSSGHLVIAERLFGIHAEGFGLEVLVNFASLLAILAIYRKDLVRLASRVWGYLRTGREDYRPDFRFALYLVLATVPAGLAGVLANDFLAEHFKGMRTVGITLLVTGAALWLIRNLRGKRNDAGLTLRDALLIGLAQTVALIPGISRSGATIVAALGLGLKQETALRFSFFLFIPISVGSMVLEGPALVRDPAFGSLAGPYLTAFLCSLAASYFSLKWFMGIMARGNLYGFALYCFAAAIGVLVFLA